MTVSGILALNCGKFSLEKMSHKVYIYLSLILNRWLYGYCLANKQADGFKCIAIGFAQPFKHDRFCIADDAACFAHSS